MVKLSNSMVGTFSSKLDSYLGAQDSFLKTYEPKNIGNQITMSTPTTNPYEAMLKSHTDLSAIKSNIFSADSSPNLVKQNLQQSLPDIKGYVKEFQTAFWETMTQGGVEVEQKTLKTILHDSLALDKFTNDWGHMT